MSRSIVFLFVDTNLFLQCRPLEDLDWSTWNAFDEVRLIVSAPVLREIDHLKNKGNDRVRRHARAASSMFRKMLSDGYRPVRVSGPCVKLLVEPRHKYCESLKGQLNYQERDDQLVGTVYEFAKHNPDADVRLLTHDTTPLYTAQANGLAMDVISDEWLLPPESNESERELRALREENARLKKAEPQFEIQCLDSDGIDIKRHEGAFTWFDPLTDAEIDNLMRYLREQFPPVTEFGPRESVKREAPQTMARILGQQQVWVPATEEDIKKYREESYPQWLADCKAVLRNYHETLQEQTPRSRFVFVAENCGTRPASDALITIEAEGSFQVKPPARDGEEADGSVDPGEGFEKKTTILLPPPPNPRGRWKTMGPFSALEDLLTHFPGKTTLPGRRLDILQPRPYIGPSLRPRDPNKFYYKPAFLEMPQNAFALECEQWRHEDGKEEFECEIHFSNDIDTVKGALVFRIQAGNLSETQIKRIPMQIKTAHVGSFDRARALVERLVRRQALGAIGFSGETGSSSHK